MNQTPFSKLVLPLVWVVHPWARVRPQLAARHTNNTKADFPRFLDPAILDTFGTFDSILGHHPDRMLVPGVEISSGSLGQGLALGVGMAVGLRLDGSASRDADV